MSQAGPRKSAMAAFSRRQLFVARLLTVALAGLASVSCGGGGADVPSTPPAPSPPAPLPVPPTPPPNPAEVAPINTAEKSEVLARFRDTYLDSTPKSWAGGSVASCAPGTLGSDYRNALVKRINFFRAMAGLPGNVSQNEPANIEAQAASLMMDANSALSHDPPRNWRCYSSVGANGAANSNICLGCAAGRPLVVVDVFIDDAGDNNKSVGHRRWLLYSRLVEVGVGETNEAGAIRIGSARTTTPAAVQNGFAWPNRGFVPRELFFPEDRWSFSCPSAEFAAATIDMRDSQGRPIVTIVESRAAGSGDNSIVWRVDLVSSPQDVWDPGLTNMAAETKVTVTINGMVGCGGGSNQTYSTTIFRAS